MSGSKIVLFGGNGFIGSAIAPKLLARGITPVIVSRKGTLPAHLIDTPWAKEAIWKAGDAAFPDARWYKDAIASICLIGSPPIPTFSKKPFEKQLYNNSRPNIGAIRGTREAGVKRVVILGAHIPSLLDTDGFGYALGKRQCMEAAEDFASGSMKRGAVVLQPFGLYGTRYNKQGEAIDLEKYLAPISRIQAKLHPTIRKFTPKQLVSVEAVAESAINACLEEEFTGRFSIISNEEICEYMEEPTPTN